MLSSAYTYDDNGNVLSKSYGESNVFTNTYDDKDRITSTSYAGKTYNYTYDTDSQLTGVTGNNYTASYEYDSRGNITSKTVNDETTSFIYANSGWKDQLISVNGTELTYDANGNVLTYGDREYTWNTGRNLASITDGTNTYSYTYDEDGIRTSKTVNGVTTYYNTKDGVILSQTDGTNNWYFQYDTNGTPLGFVLNGTQYFYLTNQMSDVLAITDTSGTIVGNYEYDAWGTVTLADTEIAQQNPLRYRGYYYDSETRYYYLQSRYYDPSICRFINADVPEIAQMSKDIPVGTNSFAYCNNDPTNNSDSDGKAIGTIIIKALSKMLLGVLVQYVGDIIYNICSGRTGKSVFRPSSSIGDYISAAITALIPGNKLVSMIARATVSSAISTFEYTIKTNKRLPLRKIIKKVFQNFALEMCCSVISSAFANKLNSLKPKNYSQFAHSQYLKNAKITPNQIKRNMKSLSKRIMISIGIFDFFVNATASAVSRKF